MNCIYMTFDEKYFPHAKACLNSIKINYPNHPKILVSYKGDPNNEIINYFRFYGDLEVITHWDMSLDQLPPSEVGSNLVYSKFSLWTDTFKDYDKILHMDCDTLVLKSLSDIFKKEDFFCVSNNEPAYLVRVFGSKIEPDVVKLLNKYYIKVPSGKDDMINAGIFMIPKKYRSTMYFNKLLEIGKEFKDHITYADQSIISLWCHYFNIPITKEFEYNFQTPFFSIKEMEEFDFDDIKILHFSGTKKPNMKDFENWDYAGKSGKKIKELYMHYANM